MKKAFDQTVRDIKREVNKKVLKVPSIEQKVLDSTSNEPWGPHGSLLADIAQATRNYHEYQMIMTVIWKRINDTGKNWRHVYKALIVLEYLVSNGSERVIDEIKEHAYQISTLSNFQYIDSSGRDQGSNIRRKSASLVDLVNDRERIIEVRQKAVANRDKFRGSSTGGTYRLSSYASTGSYGERYDDDQNESRYGSRDDGWGYRDNDRYSRSSDPYGQDIERHSRDSDERDGRDGYRDEELRGRRHSISDYQSGSRSRSSDRERQYDDDSQDSKRLGRKFSEQNIGAPPSYEEAVAGVRSPGSNRHNDEFMEATNPHVSPPQNAHPVEVTSTSAANQVSDAFDEFDPRSSIAATSAATNNTEFDLLGTLSEPVPSNALTIMPSMTPESSAPDPSFEASSSSGACEVNKGFDDPFGDSPFKAVISLDSAETHQPPVQNPNPALSGTQQPVMQNPYLALPETEQPVTQNPYLSLPGAQHPVSQNPYLTLPETQQPVVQNPNLTPEAQQSKFASMQHPTESVPPSTVASFDFGDTLGGLTYTTPGPTVPFSPNAQYLRHEPLNSNPYTDVLAGILPPPDSIHQPAPQPAAQSIFASAGGNFQQTNEGVLFHDGNFHLPTYQPQQAQMPSTMMMSAPSTNQPKFEPKSAVWADTLSRGLVNLNISGPKINPLADIGVDFDAINRKEKRMEKPVAANPVTMGKAMGSGSGIGRAGASAMRAPPGAMMGMNPPGMGMNMGYGMGMNVGQLPAQMPPGPVMPGGYNTNLGSGYTPPHQQQYPYGGAYR